MFSRNIIRMLSICTSSMEVAGNEHMTVHAHRAYRQMYVRTCMMCFVTFVLVLCCCAYCTWTMIQVQTMLAVCQGGITHASSNVHHLDPHMDTAHMPKQKSASFDKSLVVQYDTERKWRVKRKAKKGKPKGKKRAKLLAGHYHSFANREYINQHISGYTDVRLTSTSRQFMASSDECKTIAEMKGTLCRSQDFTPNSPNGTLHVFKPAAWVKKKTAPFILDEHGIFKAKSKGVYLVYAQVLFHDNYKAQIVELVQHRGGTAIQSLSCWVTVADEGQPAAYNSCGITGLFYLQKKDTLRLQNYYNDVKLNLRNSTTYLGAVLLK